MQPTIASYFGKATCSTKNNGNGEKKSMKKRSMSKISSDNEEEKDEGDMPTKDDAKDQKRKRLRPKNCDSETVMESPQKKPRLDRLKGFSNKVQKPVDPLAFFAVESKRVEGNSFCEQELSLRNETADKKLVEVNIDEMSQSPRNRNKQQTTTMHTKKSEDLEKSILSDEERFERKRAAAILYQKFKNRKSVINPGSKEVPKGKPNCLAGITFLVTGVLDSLEREEAQELITSYGGKIMSTVSKRLNYLIAGLEAGPQKLAKADEYNIKIISEDDLFNIIREKSNLELENVCDKKSEIFPKNPSPLKNTGNKSKEDTSNSKKIKIERLSESEIVKLSELGSKQGVFEDMSHLNNNVQLVHDYLAPWVDKYKPITIKDIVGQQGSDSNVNKLLKWLSEWFKHHNSNQNKTQKGNVWSKNDGSLYKAALLSGPPGIGKTTTATLVCKHLGFHITEFNASDTRSKRFLKENVSQLLDNKSIYGFCHNNHSSKEQTLTRKHVLIMDEVDGIAGNEDRGGVSELITLIKESAVPIICMCNDRNHPKMRSLVNYCYDLRFNRPQLKQIKARILSICAKENFHLDTNKIDEVITATNNDIRQSINQVALLSAGMHLKTDGEACVVKEKCPRKDLKMGPWEVVRKVFSAEEQAGMTFNEKCDLFFHDYSLTPLFVHQNYLAVSPNGPRSEILQKIAIAANALSLGDLSEKHIRTQSAWSLLPVQAIFSAVVPGKFMSGKFTGQINFPAWLGKNSKMSKCSRLAQEIHDHTRKVTSGSRLSICLDYLPYLRDKILLPLKMTGLEGIKESLDTITEYHLLREDLESIIELSSWSSKKTIWDNIDSKVKAALTRSYNKAVLPYSYTSQKSIKKRNQFANEMDIYNEDSDVSSDNSDNVENDNLIKMKKTSTVAKVKKASNGKSSNAKQLTSSTKHKK